MKIHRVRMLIATIFLLDLTFGPAGVVAEPATPSAASNWTELPNGVAFEPLTEGTVDDLLVASDLISISRIAAEPGTGVLSYYNDNPGAVGPRMLYVEENSLSTGPINVSPGSSPGPTLLVRAVEAGEPIKPAVVIPQTRVTLKPDDFIFYPADTALRINNDDTQETGYLEIDVFPVPFLLREEGEEFAGTIAHPLSLDLGIETAFPPAPPIVGIGRLSLDPGAEIAEHESGGSPTILYVEAGTLTLVAERGKLQLRRAGAASPGEFVDEEIELSFGPGDALMLPPDALASLQNSGSDPLMLLSLVINPETGKASGE